MVWKTGEESKKRLEERQTFSTQTKKHIPQKEWKELVLIQVLLSLFLILLHLSIFFVLGSGMGKLFKLSLGGLENIMVGFFSYFAIMQIIYLPSLLAKASFTFFAVAWGIICLILLISIIVYCNKGLGRNANRLLREVIMPRVNHDKKQKEGNLCNKMIGHCLFVVLFFVLSALILYQGLYNMHGFDAAFYIGTVNNTLFTDTMFLHRGETGIASRVIDMRYALSGAFYMNTAFWCRLLNLPPLMVQKYTFGSLVVILHGMLVFMIAGKLFKGDRRKIYSFSIIALLLNVFFHTGYSTSTFLLMRGFEGKGYCANVILYAVFYIALCIWGNSEGDKYWKILFIVSLGSVPIAMSSLVILPAMIFIFTTAELIVQKDKSILIKGGVSLIPNTIYLIAFLLFTLRIWRVYI